MCASESVHKLFTRTLGCPASPSHPDRVPADGHSQLLWGSLFLELVLWAGESRVGLQFLTP